MVYADFENILAPEDNWKQNRSDSYINKTIHNLWLLKKTMKILRTLLNVGSVIMIILIPMFKRSLLYQWKI